MTSKSEISIIIVNYNTFEYLRNCLQSLFGNFENRYEVIVVDNNSTDKRVLDLGNEFTHVKFFFRKVNDGFAAGCNFGADKAKGRFLLFLNPDVVLSHTPLEELSLKLMNSNESGIVSGVMLDKKSNVLYFYNNFPNLIWEVQLLFSMGIEKKIERLNSRKEILNSENFEVDWFHGAFIFLRKVDFERIGKFNEDYFMYFEDVELCYKVKKLLGKKNFCIPKLRFVHHTKSSLVDNPNDDLYTFHLNRSKLLFLRNYSFFKKMGVYTVSLVNVISRIVILPVWKKYSGRRKEKARQLGKILKLYFSKKFLEASKYEFIHR